MNDKENPSMETWQENTWRLMAQDKAIHEAKKQRVHDLEARLTAAEQESKEWEQIYLLQRGREKPILERWWAEGKLPEGVYPDHGWAYEEVLQALAAAEQQAQTNLHDLCNLLAVIHRDGGHYYTDHGQEKAVADAMSVVLDNREQVQTLNDKLNAYVDRFDEQNIHRLRLEAQARTLRAALEYVKLQCEGIDPDPLQIHDYIYYKLKKVDAALNPQSVGASGCTCKDWGWGSYHAVQNKHCPLYDTYKDPSAPERRSQR